MGQHDDRDGLADDATRYDEDDHDGGDEAEHYGARSVQAGAIVVRKDTMLVWLVSILLVLVIANALMTLDLWLTLERFREALSRVLQPGS